MGNIEEKCELENENDLKCEKEILKCGYCKKFYCRKHKYFSKCQWYQCKTPLCIKCASRCSVCKPHIKNFLKAGIIYQ